ncbi:putative fatty acyl-CoA reductase CG5065 [Centruroides sculpturatus]|uniref:putative fatty acyl-CoA reductase CG5065 n=1 Tax=Centruroides sculpturatus TaxID=218467 RepID=UPI000C6D32D0|nr:putative fatty acyl-CoA reductase CG5065 [Centruroides sculpturatus]
MFRADNVEKLFKSMSTQDKQNFNFDISKLSWDKYLENYVLGTRRYVLKEDDSTIPRSKKTLLMKYYCISLVKTVFVLGLICSVSFFVLSF